MERFLFSPSTAGFKRIWFLVLFSYIVAQSTFEFFLFISAWSILFITLFSKLSRIWKQKLPLKQILFFTRCLPIELALNDPTLVVHVSECQIFFHQKRCWLRWKIFANVARPAKKTEKRNNSNETKNEKMPKKPQKTKKNRKKHRKSRKTEKPTKTLQTKKPRNRKKTKKILKKLKENPKKKRKITNVQETKKA